MGLSYQEAIDIEVTRAEAVRELEKHGADLAEFFADCGECDSYPGAVVLGWLGY